MSKIQAVVNKAKARREGADRLPDRADTQLSAKAGRPGQKIGPRINISTLPVVEVDAGILTANRILTHDEAARQHPVQSAYRMLRTRLMQAMRGNNWRILGVSSLGEDEGKSFTAINLAISIAAEYGQEALLVDLDLRKPSIYKMLGMTAEDVPGLRDYLVSQDGDLAGLFVNPGIERLGILPSAEPLERSSDLLASPRGKELFAQLRGRTPESSIVVVDLPPLLAADDALAVAPMLDALLLVVAEGEAEREALLDAREMLDAFNLVGTVLNKSVDKDSKRSSYY